MLNKKQIQSAIEEAKIQFEDEELRIEIEKQKKILRQKKNRSPWHRIFPWKLVRR